MNDSLILLLILSLILLLTLFIAISCKLPMAEDITFHLDVAYDYYTGSSVSQVLQKIRMPYPPLFHFLLMPTFLFKSLSWVMFLQIIFYPLAFLTTFHLVRLGLSSKHAMITVLLLIASYGFFDRTVQVQPQAIDMILFPLAAYSFFKERKLMFTLLNAVMFFCHSFFGMLLFGSFILFWIFKRRGLGMILIAGLTMLPVLLMTYPVIIDKLNVATTIRESQNTAVREKPMFALMYLGAVTVFLPLLPTLWKDVRKNDFLLFAVCWLAALTPMLFTITDRYITYAVVPLSILASAYIINMKPTARGIFVSFVWIMAGVMLIYYFYMAMVGGYHIDAEHLAEILAKIGS